MVGKQSRVLRKPGAATGRDQHSVEGAAAAARITTGHSALAAGSPIGPRTYTSAARLAPFSNVLLNFLSVMF